MIDWIDSAWLKRALNALVAGAAVAAVASGAGAQPTGTAAPVLRTVVDAPLPGPAVRFDYQSLDTSTNRLYIAHMDAGQLVVFDIRTRQVIANLDGFDAVHGVIAVPATGRVYASVTGRRQVAVVDATSLAVLARVGEIRYPNGLAYAPSTDRIFVSDNGGTDAVIDAKTNTLIASIPLGGGAGNTVYDPGSRHILVTVHGRNELVAIDPGTLHIVSRVPLTGIGNAHGMVLDPERRIAFIAGTANATVAIVDLTTMHVTHTYDVAASPDVLAYDPGWRRLYVSSESGGVSIFTERDDGAGIALTLDGEISIPHAHTVSVDPRSHLVYFPLENVAEKPLLRIMAGIAPTRTQPYTTGVAASRAQPMRASCLTPEPLHSAARERPHFSTGRRNHPSSPL